MTLIGENIHIISPKVKEAIINKDDTFILNLVQKQLDLGISTLDLNVGPAKSALFGSLKYLVNLIQNNFRNVNFSLDTTNLDEMEDGILSVNNPDKCFLNSASADYERLERVSELAIENNSNLIALTMSKNGIASTSDERLELAFEIYEHAQSVSLDTSKIYFDPLILPVCVKQNQAIVALETIRMIKESFEETKTIIGLSNISNGALKELRPLINRVFFVLALGYGLDGAIIDGTDKDIIDIYNKIKNSKCETKNDKLYFDLYEMAQTFGDLRDIKYNKDDVEEKNIYKTAQILLNKEIYSPSYAEFRSEV